jgi:hypothetical protein
MVISLVPVWYHLGFPETWGTIMAKKKTGGRKVPATAQEEIVRHARIELPDSDYSRLKSQADRVRISVAAYIRQAVMERIETDERRHGSRD